EKQPSVAATGAAVKGGGVAPSADDLFELHVRLRRAPGGIDVLLAGTAPSAQGAAAAAEQINLIRDQGMVGLLVVPLVLKSNADTLRAVRSAWGSVKAEANGTRLMLTASIPNEVIAAARDAADAALRFGKGLLGGK